MVLSWRNVYRERKKKDGDQLASATGDQVKRMVG